MRSRAVAWIAVAGLVVVAAFLVDTETLRRAAVSVARQPLPLLLALGAYTVAFVLRALAWGELIPVPVPLLRRIRALFAMLAVNHALPGPVGEVARAKVVTGPDLPMGRALVSVTAARVVDVGAIAFLLLTCA